MGARKADNISIPTDLQPLFWDSDFDLLSWERDRDFITARILTFGEWDAVRWLRETTGDASLLDWLAQDLRDEGAPFVTGSTERGTLHGMMEGVRLSFIEYHYPQLEPLVFWPEFGCHLASMADLACMKLSAVAQRGSKKDFHRHLCPRHQQIFPGKRSKRPSRSGCGRLRDKSATSWVQRDGIHLTQLRLHPF